MIGRIDQNQLGVATPMSQYLPGEGPKAIPLTLDFATVDTWALDMELMQARAYMSMVQTLYVDTTNLTANLTVTVGGTGQILTIKANTQGYYPVLAPNPVRMTFQHSVQIAGEVARIQLINVPIAGCVWAPA